MKNFQHFLITLGLSCTCFMINAQQVYDAQHYGSSGDIYLYNRFAPGPGGPDITLGGTNALWDLSTYTALSTHTNELADPADGINQFTFLSICALSGFSTLECFDIWNSTDQVLLLEDTLDLMGFQLRKLQRYQTKANNVLLENFLGFTVDFNGLPTSAVIVYDQPDTIIHFPAAYGDAWTSQMNFAIDLTPVGQSLNYISHQSRETSMDSWGTLMTPYDTFENVIRLRSDILRDDTLILDGQVFPFSFTQVEYMWLDTQYTLPVMTANGILGPNDTVVINAFEYIYESNCATPTWTVSTGSDVFYLGQDGTVTIEFTVENSNANIYTFDYGDGTFEDSEGSVSHTFSVAGEYAVAIIGCMTNCLPLNSCSFQIVDFEILDTLTSLHPIAGETIDIRLYPNPVSEFIQLDFADQHLYTEYTILDATGSLKTGGRVSQGIQRIDASMLSPGMYVMLLHNRDQPDIPSVFLRFCKTSF